MIEQSSARQWPLLAKFSLEDKVAIITGAGGGIGSGVALAFAQVGAHLVLTDAVPEKVSTIAEKVEALGRRTLPIVADVTDGKQVENLVAKSLREFGRIDVLVNIAGGNPWGYRIPTLEMPEHVWDEIIEVNLKTTFLCCKSVGRAMIDQRKGSIINFGSQQSKEPHPRLTPYSAAKAAVLNFTEALAINLAPYNVRVNCILPGRIETGATSYQGSPEFRAKETGIPLGRVGQPEDIALAVMYLASDASSWVTGIALDVCGGPWLGGLTLKIAEDIWAKGKKP